MLVHGKGEAAEELRAIFRKSEEKSRERRKQEDADYEVVSERLQWLVENQYQVSAEYLAHDTGVPLERLEAIEDRLGELAREFVGDGSYCP